MCPNNIYDESEHSFQRKIELELVGRTNAINSDQCVRAFSYEIFAPFPATFHSTEKYASGHLNNAVSMAFGKKSLKILIV